MAQASLKAWQHARKQLAIQAWSLECDAKRELAQQRQVELKAISQEEEQKRQRWEQELWSDLTQLRKRLEALSRNLQLAGSEELRQMVSTMEHKLKVQSEQSRQEYEELCAEEIHLEEALQASLARFDAWTSCASAVAPARSARSATPARAPRARSARSAPGRRRSGPSRARTGRDVKARVEEISKKLATPRHVGGWCQADHDAFLRLLVGRFRGRATGDFLAEAQELLPHLQHEQLLQHARWMLEQDALRAERQQLLDAWRAEKATEAQRPIAQEAQQESQEQLRAEEKRRQSLAEKKKQVEAWRRQKGLEAERLAAEKLRCEEEQRRKAQRRREELQTKKQDMEQWREVKKEALRQSKRASQAPSSVPLSHEQLQRLRARSEQLLRHREQLQSAAKAAKGRFAPPERAAKSEAYAHVQGRLSSSTQDFVLRARERQEEEVATFCRGRVAGNFAHQGLVRTLRASPGWRNMC